MLIIACRLPGATWAALVALLAASSQAGEQWRASTTPRLGLFAPTTGLGPWLTARARTGAGVSLGLTVEATRHDGIGGRVAWDAALGAGPRVASADCARSCGHQNTYAAVVALAVGDVVVPLTSQRRRVSVFLGGGVKAYLFPATGSDCSPYDDICAATLHFTEHRYDPTLHAAVALSHPIGRRELRFELGDYLS